ncbi:unnamed protein product [Tilletia controversa]|uniref:Uncharacterized protein n=1 Tax=Tilletia caries TaxID=13290 RepID=A0ABN7J6X8_9BASI|nr:hypothetical protein CF335_g9748 [Tilletia laevis]CAD6897371.1 unnamed protein product [Tilletia controversa]CAD6915392.1 unnamed protein product [Tilletia controversa]CAD6951216.1 unnamed protein product [Tilletia caries]CAD7063648.1 unnamed protein product [Tilletia caries]
MDAITDALCHLAPDSLRIFAQELVAATSTRAPEEIHVCQQLSDAVRPLLVSTPHPQHSSSPPNSSSGVPPSPDTRNPQDAGVDGAGKAPTSPDVAPGVTSSAQTEDTTQKDDAGQGANGKDDGQDKDKAGAPETEQPDAGQATIPPDAAPGVTPSVPTDDAGAARRVVRGRSSSSSSRTRFCPFCFFLPLNVFFLPWVDRAHGVPVVARALDSLVTRGCHADGGTRRNAMSFI